MEKIKDLPVGATFEYEGKTYEVLKGYWCSGVDDYIMCDFFEKDCQRMIKQGIIPQCYMKIIQWCIIERLQKNRNK